MPKLMNPNEFLNACAVGAEVFQLRPDYRALLLVVEGLSLDRREEGLEEDGAIDELVASAEAHARELLASTPVEELEHIAAWREAYRAFGAKPQRTRNSLEALTRRAEKGLPRVNALTDIYNAISVLHQIPLGGEDFELYDGPAHLIRALGTEPFDTTSHGEHLIEYPAEGEVVWCDDAGVTCRRWNWRQGTRTPLSDETQTAFFIFDALAPVSDEQLRAAANSLVEALSGLGVVRTSTRLLSA